MITINTEFKFYPTIFNEDEDEANRWCFVVKDPSYDDLMKLKELTEDTSMSQLEKFNLVLSIVPEDIKKEINAALKTGNIQSVQELLGSLLGHPNFNVGDNLKVIKNLMVETEADMKEVGENIKTQIIRIEGLKTEHVDITDINILLNEETGLQMYAYQALFELSQEILDRYDGKKAKQLEKKSMPCSYAGPADISTSQE